MRKRLANKGWSRSDFTDDLSGLAAELVSLDAYRSAVDAGRTAVPNGEPLTDDPVVAAWTGRVGHYARMVAARIAENLGDAAAAIADEPDATDESILGAIEDTLENQRHAVTRYAEPVWGAGNNGYGDELGENGVLVDWEIGDDNPCPDCSTLEAKSPYGRGEVPTWPGAGETDCMDNCHCAIVADQDSWDAVFANPEDA